MLVRFEHCLPLAKTSSCQQGRDLARLDGTQVLPTWVIYSPVCGGLLRMYDAYMLQDSLGQTHTYQSHMDGQHMVATAMLCVNAAAPASGASSTVFGFEDMAWLRSPSMTRNNLHGKTSDHRACAASPCSFCIPVGKASKVLAANIQTGFPYLEQVSKAPTNWLSREIDRMIWSVPPLLSRVQGMSELAYSSKQCLLNEPMADSRFLAVNWRSKQFHL